MRNRTVFVPNLGSSKTHPNLLRKSRSHGSRFHARRDYQVPQSDWLRALDYSSLNHSQSNFCNFFFERCLEQSMLTHELLCQSLNHSVQTKNLPQRIDGKHRAGAEIQSDFRRLFLFPVNIQNMLHVKEGILRCRRRSNSCFIEL